MNLSKINVFSRSAFLEECKTFFSATLISLLVFGGTYTYDAYAQSTATNTLTVTITAATTFTVSTNSFPPLTPGTPQQATSTIKVVTNEYSSGSSVGWNVQMYGNNQGSGAASTTLFLSPTTYATGIADGVEWNATTTATTTSASLTSTTITSGDDFLYFRVMTASGSVPFRSTAWWGTDDTPFTNAKWAGVASSTIGRRIGVTSPFDANASSTINTVQYYLDVPVNQSQGAYTGNLTFTWTAGA